MHTKLITLATSLALSSALLVSGCKSSTAPAPAAQPATPPTTQGTSAPAPTQVSPDQTAPPASVASSSTPAPAVPPGSAAPGTYPGPTVAPAPVAPRVLSAAAGSRVAVTITETLKASTSNVGDGFTGVLAQPLLAKGGGTVFPRGTRVTGTVVASKGRGRFKGAGALGIELTSIGDSRVSTSEYEKEEKGRGKRTGAFIGGGTGVGALIGGLAGGGKGALIGGLAGAGAGTAGAGYTGNHDVTIPSESLVTFTLRTPVSR